MYDDSGTDMIFSRFSITVACSVHPGVTGGAHGVVVPGFSSSQPVTEWAQAIERLLATPRCVLEYSLGDHRRLCVVPQAGSIYSDCDNGPKPRDVRVTQVSGSKLLRIEFSIDACLVRCVDYPSNMQVSGVLADRNVLNNRWSISEERDSQMLMTRTVEGVLRTAHIVKRPHAYRYLCLPPLQAGYRRENMRFWDSADGLTLHYQITDKQRYTAPPPPAINWYATYTESAVNQGMLQFGEVRVVLEGHPETDKRDLLTAAIKVVLARLTGLRREQPEGEQHSCFIRQFAVVEHLHENRLEVTAMVQHNTIDEHYLNLRVNKIGEDLSADEMFSTTYDRYAWPNPYPYDPGAPFAPFLKYWQSPCNEYHGLVDVEATQPSHEYELKEETPRDEGAYDLAQKEVLPPGSPLPEDPGRRVSDAQQAGYPYTVYEIDNDYLVDEGVNAFPVSGIAEVKRESITTRAIRVHSGAATRIVHIHAERVGQWPHFPEPKKVWTDSNGIQYTLLGWKLCPAQPTLMADGRTKEFSCQVRYVYSMSRPPLLADALQVGIDPRCNFEITDALLKLQDVLQMGVATT